MRDEALPKAFLRARQSGKTTELLRWLLRGHRVDEPPGWSRVVLTANRQTLKHMLLSFRWVDEELKRRRFTHGFNGVIYTLDEAAHPPQRLWFAGSQVEVAIDNLDLYLQSQLGFLPALFSMTGEIYEPEVEERPLPEQPTFDAFRHHFGNLGNPPNYSDDA